MSDYAGTVGAVLNVAGMATGQLWLSAIGIGLQAWGASQQVLPGPKIGDVQKQVAQEGSAIPIVFGYSPPIMGTVVADMREPLIVTKRESQGKGGPKVESESAFRTYAIMFCEGESTLRQAWKNGQIVYNVDDPGMAADNAKFLEYATWLSGSYDQMPHPALEELYGVGNAPAFRGRSVLVLDKEDVTDMRGARSQWHVRVFRGAAKSYTTPPYPVETFDSSWLQFSAVGGQMRTIYKESNTTPSVASMSFSVAGGSLFEALPPEWEPDAAQIGFAAVGGKLAVPPSGNFSDEAGITFTVVGGRLFNAPVGTFDAEAKIVFGPVGGTLYEP